MSFSVKILGCGSALPMVKRFATAQIFEHNSHLFLIDCAEATQVQMMRYGVRLGMLNHIFISHLHGDHFFGIFGLLSSFSLMGRTADLHIFADIGLQNMLEAETSPVKLDELGFKVLFHSLNHKNPELIFENKSITVTSFPLRHRVPVCGFLFKEKVLQRNIIKDCIEKYNISIADIVRIKNGNDYVCNDGKVIPNTDLTIDPPKPVSYAFVTDTRYREDIVDIIKGCDLLYHEATYENALLTRAKETFHCTAGQAATIAKKAGVGKLIIGHYSGRYKDASLLEKQAREIFPLSYAVDDGDVFEVKTLKK